MTKEEAIRLLEETKRYHLEAVCEAIDMAIEELSAKPSEEEVDDYCNNCPYISWDGDLISRQAAIDAICGTCADYEDEKHKDCWLYRFGKCCDIPAPESLPPVTPTERTGEWVPMIFSEDGMITNFPHERDGQWVLVTNGKQISIERIKKDAYDHFYPNGRWFELEDTIAWAPIPNYDISKVPLPKYKGGDAEC